MRQSLPANDSNPKNRVTVKMNHSVFGINPKKDYIKESCWVLEPKPIKLVPQKTISVKRKYIITSVKKYLGLNKEPNSLSSALRRGISSMQSINSR
jgi:hypothetical protein